MYINGKKFATIKTVYNPIGKGMTLKKAMEINKNKIDNVERDSKIVGSNIQPMSYTTIHYWWDGVYFVKGHMIKYPHPDYDHYGIEPGDLWIKEGYRLYHCKLPDYVADGLAPVIIAGIIGECVDIEGGGIIAGIIAYFSAYIIKDEHNSIWFWFSKSCEWKYFESGGILGWHYVPKYVRVADFTLWDDAYIGNP